MKELLRQRARELGFDDCRFTTARAPDHADRFQDWLSQKRHGEMGYLERNAHKRLDPQAVLADARSVVIVAASYAGNVFERLPAGTGAVARYARFKDYHDVMGERLAALTKDLQGAAGDNTRSLWYVDTGPLLERDLAQRAGLGFAGKHTNLISRRLGNWFFLGEIITTLEIEPDAAEANHCGNCTRCLTACPTQAIVAPFQLDARRCISYLTIELKGAIPHELRPAIGNRIYGCDDCLAACPWNKFAREGALMRPHARPDLCAPELLELLRLDEPGFKARFAGTPLLRTKRRGLLRNVCVALGNVGEADAVPALEKAARDAEPLIAEHARWAIEQIKRRNALSQPEKSSGAPRL
ncbi:MAG: tRNA epoxyqueuosine(34) reductase QueG [Verrucomicrobiota bacterium]